MGHMDTTKTMGNGHKHFYWPNKQADIEEWLHTAQSAPVVKQQKKGSHTHLCIRISRYLDNLCSLSV